MTYEDYQKVGPYCKIKIVLQILIPFLTLMLTSVLQAEAKVINIDAGDFINANLTEKKHERFTRKNGCIGCDLPGEEWTPALGRLDYSFYVETSGFYMLEVLPEKGGPKPWYRFYIDSDGPVFPLNGKIGWVYLQKGEHLLGVSTYFWIGFTKVTGFRLTLSNGSLMQSIRIESLASNVAKVGDDYKLKIHYNENTPDGTLKVVVQNRKTLKYKKYEFAIELQKGKKEKEVSIPIELEGDLEITCYSFSTRDNDSVVFDLFAIDTENAQPGGVTKKLIKEIDCATHFPEYFGGGEPSNVTHSGMEYVESGATGFRTRGNQNETDPSWFAYKVKVPKKDVPYLFEIDYPDNATRSFAVSVMDSTGMYASSSGVDSGGEFYLSQSIQTLSIIRWAAEKDMRVVFMNAHDGFRAAAARIRVYQMDVQSPIISPVSKGREYVHWYEENKSFLNLVGMDQTQAVAGYAEGCSRWADLLALNGHNTMMMTVNAYGLPLYPTRYELDANPSAPDIVKILLLEAEKRDMGFIAEFHPTAKELLLNYSVPADNNLMISRKGEIPLDRNPFEPKYNPLYPENQEWMIGLVGDFVDKYRHFKAFKGVSLRFMQWQNSGLYSFHNSEWGYDDYTLTMFQTETGITVPIDKEDPEKYQKRYDWLSANAEKEWIQWRARKVTDIIQRIRDRIRESSPNITLYLHDTALEFRPAGKRQIPNYEKGLSNKLLASIEGVQLINGRYRHGRKKSDSHVWKREYLWQLLRDELIDPDKLCSLSTDKTNAFLFSMHYLEASSKVVPLRDLGYMSGKKGMWSVSVEPAGRNSLEPYALAMAASDPIFLGDGGNNYTFGPPIVSEFLDVYNALPRAHFKLLNDSDDSVILRERKTDTSHLFYVVNREAYENRVQVLLSALGNPGSVNVVSIPSGTSVNANNMQIDLLLKPFEIEAFEIPLGCLLNSIEIQTPEKIKSSRINMAIWINAFAQKAAVQEWAEAEYIQSVAEAVHQAMHKEKWWKVITLLQQAEMIRIYEERGEYPHGLREEADEL